MALTSTFAALRERNFALFFTGQVLSVTGAWMERAALAALVYEITGLDEVWLGYVAVAPLLPVLALSVPAGALADRLSLRPMIIGTQSAMMLGAAVVTVLTFLGAVQPWHLVLYAAYSGAAFAVDAPARQAMVVQLVPREQLTNAIALNATSFNAARVGGAAAFAAVIVLVRKSGLDIAHPEAVCMAVNTVSYGFVIGGLLLMRNLPGRTGSAGARRGLADGLAYAWRTPHARAALAVILTTAMFGFQVSHLLPVYAEKIWHTGKEGLGELHAALGTGALLGGLVLATVSRHVHRGQLVLACGGIGPLLLIAFATTPSFAIGLAALCGAGFVMVQTHVTCNALLQTHVPDHLRGRVMALFTLAVLSAFPIGGLMAGELSKRVGAPLTTLIDTAIVLIAAAVIHLTHPQLRRSP